MAKNYELNWARTHAGLTQAEAAEKMGVNRITFSRWEVGTVAIPPARWAKFLKLIEVSAEDIPAEGLEVVPEYIDGELSTPYLPMRLQRVAESDWPPADKKQWAKSMEEDADGLRDDWMSHFAHTHDHSLEDRATNVLWAKNGWLEFTPSGSYSLTPRGRAHEANLALDVADLI